MRFNKDNGNMNPNYEAEVEARSEALKLIEVIDENLDYVTDGLPEYEEIKEHVQKFVPVQRFEDKLSEDEQRVLERKFEELKELAKSLK